MKFTTALFLLSSLIASSDAENVRKLMMSRKMGMRSSSSSSSDNVFVPMGRPFRVDNIIASGDQEVPSVESDTSASLYLKFDAAFTQVHFNLGIMDGTAITQVHLHCAGAGVNGPVITTLLNGDIPVPGPGGIDIDNENFKGTVTNAMINPTMCEGSDLMVNNVASLYEAILQRQVYLNVHSEGNPPGEVRAQIFP